MTTRSSRRTFLATAVGAAVAPALSFSTPTGPTAKARRLKVGLASYSVRKFTLDQALEMCKEMEHPYINLKDFHLPMTDSPEAICRAEDNRGRGPHDHGRRDDHPEERRRAGAEGLRVREGRRLPARWPPRSPPPST